ncbi:hypothetical protein CSUI_000303 [Cystoisospora suis]|uniref:Uncharacterized protein n=1 Tax=Cystoisospora suis TaxID=483139 RepID=A0A2C6LHC5_9APIC|nr:hypothetical protein CSUI_000303 [Cystoisospora suis]
MVLLPPDEFFRSFFHLSSTSTSLSSASHDQRSSSPPPHPPVSFLVFCTPEVDSVCCCHLISTYLNSQLIFSDTQWDRGNIALDLEIVNGIPDVLSWIDRHLDIHLDRCSIASPHPGGLPRLEQPSLFRLPFYDRILFIGLGGLADCETGANERGGGSSLNALTSTLYAAVTDLFLYKAVKQQALDEFRRRKRREELRKRHSLHHGGNFTSSSSSGLYNNGGEGNGDDAYSSSSGVVTPEDEAAVLRLESRIRSKIKIAVLDSRRPLHGALMMRDGDWMMPMESSEQDLLERRQRERREMRGGGGEGGGGSSFLSDGLYSGKPCAAVLAKVLEPLYEVESSRYVFGAAVSAASFLQSEWMANDDYNDLIFSLKDLNISAVPFLRDDDSSGLLPLLRNGSLQDSLSIAPSLCVSSAKGENFSFPASSLLGKAARGGAGGLTYLQHCNELRVQCGITCKAMTEPFSGLEVAQQKIVFEYLRQTLRLPDRYCLNWIRHAHQERERGNFMTIPNADAAFLLQALLARSAAQDLKSSSAAYRWNAVEALQLLARITSTTTAEQVVALEQLREVQALAVHQHRQLLSHLNLARSSSYGRGGVLLVTLQHPRGFLLHPAYIRSFALLCSLKHAHGNESKRLPVILHIVTQREAFTPQAGSKGGGERSLLYACTPNADPESPDIFPYVLCKMVGSGYSTNKKKNHEFSKRRRRKKKRRNLSGEGDEDSENEQHEDGVEEGEDRDGDEGEGVSRHTSHGRPGITRDGGCPYMIHVAVGRGLGADIQRQIAALYLREVRRRAEEEDIETGGSEVEDELSELDGDEEEEGDHNDADGDRHDETGDGYRHQQSDRDGGSEHFLLPSDDEDGARRRVEEDHSGRGEGGEESEENDGKDQWNGARSDGGSDGEDPLDHHENKRRYSVSSAGTSDDHSRALISGRRVEHPERSQKRGGGGAAEGKPRRQNSTGVISSSLGTSREE